LPVKYAGLREIPPTLEPLTVTVHVGEDEEIIGMTTVEVEDIEGCVSIKCMEYIFTLKTQRKIVNISVRKASLYMHVAIVPSYEIYTIF